MSKSFEQLMSEITGMKVTLCPKCGEMLAHRNGVPLPCTTCKKETK